MARSDRPAAGFDSPAAYRRPLEMAYRPEARRAPERPAVAPVRHLRPVEVAACRRSALGKGEGGADGLSTLSQLHPIQRRSVSTGRRCRVRRRIVTGAVIVTVAVLRDGCGIIGGMVLTPAERARRYRARKGATPRTELEPCGTLAAWHRHVRQRAKLRRDGVAEADLPVIDAECRQAAQRHQEDMRARRTAAAVPAPAPEPEPVVEAEPGPVKPAKHGKLVRHTDPRTAATYYVWTHPAGVHLEARRRRFPDGRQRWELHHVEGSAIPAAAEHADPVGDAWVKLGDLRLDLAHLAAALDVIP